MRRAQRGRMTVVVGRRRARLLRMPRSPTLLTRREASSALLGIGGAVWLAPSVAWAGGWEKTSSRDGITVYRKSVPGSALKGFRGTVVIDAPMEKLVWVLADNTRRKDWTDRLETSTILERRSAYDCVMYQRYSAPAIISDRDFVFRAAAYTRPSGEAVLDVASVVHPKAPKSPGVRGELQQNRFGLRSLGPSKTHVDAVIFADPKGSIPAWVVNLVQKSWPMNTLQALREHVSKPFVQSMPLPPLRS